MVPIPLVRAVYQAVTLVTAPIPSGPTLSQIRVPSVSELCGGTAEVNASRLVSKLSVSGTV